MRLCSLHIQDFLAKLLVSEVDLHTPFHSRNQVFHRCYKKILVSVLGVGINFGVSMIEILIESVHNFQDVHEYWLQRVIFAKLHNLDRS